MSLKKDENKKKYKLSFFRFKLFLRSKKILKWNPPIELKVSIVLSMIYISLKTNREFRKLDKITIKEVYFKFFKENSCPHKEFFVELLNNSVKKFDFGFRIDFLDGEKFYDNLYSFFANSSILDYSSGKKKLKKIIIEEEGLENFIQLNENLKSIMIFIKKSSPTKFNWIFRKIMSLT